MPDFTEPKPSVTAAVTSGQGVLQRIAPQWRTRKVTAERGIALGIAAALLFWTLAVTLWSLAFVWTLTVGLFTWPIRLVTRSRRKRKREENRHAETLDALRRVGGDA